MDIVSDGTMSASIKTATYYHEWVFKSFSSFLLPGSALEIGSGHGQYSKRIAAIVDDLIVSDIDPLAINRIQNELHTIHNVRYLTMDGIDNNQLNEKVNNIVLINVLEHIEKDKDFLVQCKSSLTPDGLIIIFVPAFQLLYSCMDKEAGHFRRYRRDTLTQMMQGLGFRIKHARYFNSVGFFGWYANKLLNSGIHAKNTNMQISLYNKLIPILKNVDYLLPFIGQSVLIIGQNNTAESCVV